MKGHVVFGKKGATNINVEKEKAPSWRERMHGKLAESERRNPNRVAPVQSQNVKIVRRPMVVDLEQVPPPMSMMDVLDSLPTINLARRATLERMRANKVVSMEDEMYSTEAEEFDEEVRDEMQENFGTRDVRDRQDRAQDIGSRYPVPEEEMAGPRMPAVHRRRAFDDDPNLI